MEEGPEARPSALGKVAVQEVIGLKIIYDCTNQLRFLGYKIKGKPYYLIL